MPGESIQEQIIKYLTDVHSTEENAIRQLRTGADSAQDDALVAVLREHLAETQEHERLVRARLEALGESPSSLKDRAEERRRLDGSDLGCGPGHDRQDRDSGVHHRASGDRVLSLAKRGGRARRRPGNRPVG